MEISVDEGGSDERRGRMKMEVEGDGAQADLHLGLKKRIGSDLLIYFGFGRERDYVSPAADTRGSCRHFKIRVYVFVSAFRFRGVFSELTNVMIE